MRKFILTITLNPCVDMTYYSKSFKPPRKDQLFLSAGGKGINVSRALRILGVKTVTSGILGGNVGHWIKDGLKAEKIPHDFVTIKENSRINVTVYQSRLQKPKRILEGGPGLTRKVFDQLKRKIKKHLKQSRMLVLSGRNAKGLSDNSYAQLISLAHQNGILAVLDTGGKALKASLSARPDILKINHSELEDLTGRRLKSVSAMMKASGRLLKKGITMVLITRGQKGAIGLCGKRMMLVSAPKIQRVSDVGCGDAFLSGFLYALVNKFSFEGCLQCAAASGAAAAVSSIPGSIDSDLFLKMIKCVSVKTLA